MTVAGGPARRVLRDRAGAVRHVGGHRGGHRRGDATGYARRTVIGELVTGTTVLDVTDPDGDDNGPGTYAYPTSADFQPGAFDLQRFQVIADGDNVLLRAKVRDLTPTFGSPLGAQLLDVYVHTPDAAPTSTAAAFPQPELHDRRRLGLEPADRGAGLRRPGLRGRRPGSALGTVVGAGQPGVGLHHDHRPGGRARARRRPGWKFAVVLHGQDGFSPDQARGFAPTPQHFQFGVCAPGGTRPDLRGRPGHGAEGDGRADPGRRLPGRRARPDRAPGRDHRGAGASSP